MAGFKKCRNVSDFGVVRALGVCGRKKRKRETDMELPVALKQGIEDLTAGYRQDQMEKTARELSDRYRNESGTGRTLLSGDLEAAVYALVRMPATYGAVSDALRYALECYDAPMKSLLDAGAGSGAAAWAAAGQLALEQITCVERERAMSRIGEALMREGGQALSRAKWLHLDLTADPLTAEADLVISSYVMNEMTEKDRRLVLDRLWACAGKMLLVVEPGTPAGFAVIRDIRARLLQQGAHIAAPCPHEGECRLAEKDWCHVTCRIQRSKLHKALKHGDAPYEDEKYTYMAFVREEIPRAKARILRHPYIAKGQIGLEICGETENRKAVVTKKDGACFREARKAKQGDSFRLPGDSSRNLSGRN